MKIKNIILSALAVSALMFSSCTDDLNTVPLNDTDFVTDKAYTDDINTYMQGLSKLYSGFCAVGQAGPGGSPDIAVEDGGSSELVRMWWSLNEFSTDEVKCAWKDDSYVREMNFNTWTNATNFAIFVVYNRFMLGATLVNEYLRQTTDDRLSGRGCNDATITQVHQLRDEARFIRAYMYWIGLDMFGNIPFVTEDDPVGAFMPQRKTRTEVYDYVVAELTDLTSSTSNLPAIGAATYPRIDKGAVWGLLSRIYLNSEIYTGTAHWSDAMNAARELITSGQYDLATDYDDLFRGDNGRNADVLKEFIFAVDYDATNTQTYGGTRFLCCAAYASGDLEDVVTGTDGGWGGIRTSVDFVRRFFPDVTGENYTSGAFTCTDKRAKQFYIKDRTSGSISDWTDFMQGWSVFKYLAVPSTDKANPSAFGNRMSWSDVDFPLIRYAEVLLNYAEASVRSGSPDATAIAAYNSIRTRAGLAAAGTFTLDQLYEERTRELMWKACAVSI